MITNKSPYGRVDDSSCFNEYGHKYSDMLKNGISSGEVAKVIEACDKLKGHGSYDYDMRIALPLAQEQGKVEMIDAIKEHCGYYIEKAVPCTDRISPTAEAIKSVSREDFNAHGQKYTNTLIEAINSENVALAAESCDQLNGHGSYDYDMYKAFPIAQNLSNAEMISAVIEHCGYDRPNGELCVVGEYSVNYSGDYTITSCDQL